MWRRIDSFGIQGLNLWFSEEGGDTDALGEQLRVEEEGLLRYRPGGDCGVIMKLNFSTSSIGPRLDLAHSGVPYISLDWASREAKFLGNKDLGWMSLPPKFSLLLLRNPGRDVVGVLSSENNLEVRGGATSNLMTETCLRFRNSIRFRISNRRWFSSKL